MDSIRNAPEIGDTMWFLDKGSFDSDQLQAVALLTDSFHKFEKSQCLKVRPVLNRVDIRRKRRPMTGRNKNGTVDFDFAVSGMVLFDKIMVRFDMKMVHRTAGDLFRDTHLVLKLKGTTYYAYPMVEHDGGNRGIGSWDRHPIFCQTGPKYVDFSKVIAEATT